MVLANDLFVLYLSYTMEIMLDKKQIQDIFLFEFQMGHKAAEELAASKHICFRSNGGGENQEVLQSEGELLSSGPVSQHCTFTVTK